MVRLFNCTWSSNVCKMAVNSQSNCLLFMHVNLSDLSGFALAAAEMQRREKGECACECRIVCVLFQHDCTYKIFRLTFFLNVRYGIITYRLQGLDRAGDGKLRRSGSHTPSHQEISEGEQLQGDGNHGHCWWSWRLVQLCPSLCASRTLDRLGGWRMQWSGMDFCRVKAEGES